MDTETKRFFKEAFAFSAAVILILGTINFAYSEFVLDKHVLQKKDRSYEEYFNALGANKTIKYAYFGDSHIFCDINPEFVNDSYNFAVGAENYIKTYYKLRQVLNQDKVRIQNVVLEIDLHTFSTKTTTGNFLMHELWYYRRFVPYQDISAITGKSLVDVFIRSHLPVVGVREELLTKNLERIPPLKVGWYCEKGNFSGVSNKTLAGIQRIQLHFNNQNRTSPIALEYFGKTLELARENNITVILLKSPVSKEYDEGAAYMNITKDDYYEAVFEAANQAVDEFFILDYYSSYFNNTEYFSDADHLNCHGSEVFSKKLSDDLKNLEKK
jgi:hypothetical protein